MGSVIKEEIEILECLSKKERVHMILELAGLHIRHTRVAACLSNKEKERLVQISATEKKRQRGCEQGSIRSIFGVHHTTRVWF